MTRLRRGEHGAPVARVENDVVDDVHKEARAVEAGTSEEERMRKVAVLGSEPVAKVLSRGLKEHGYEVRIGNRSPEKIGAFGKESGIPTGTLSEAAAWAEAVVLAVVGRAAREVLAVAGASNLKGKIVIDATNPIAEGPPVDGVLRFFAGPNDSLMERLQEAFPDARFAKAFNSVGNACMVHPSFPGGKPTMFYCGNDAQAKAAVARLIRELGWEDADMGTAVAVRAIEPLCQLWCIPGFRENRWSHAFKLLRQ
jgi:8-hydroxy-5-deazaflavin:NADPH oxidoreductase